ncbi:diaminopimelate decarboxylase [Microbacterium sp. CJ77]|uniref:diaminopimelate decarboxylase n=1 Tax=Microbacterium sp. CJ77 TaxID=2079201 RepID=UPI000CD84359|nr:diaminopimelate decarboxylase [Microbacterium sp. CJ77]
MSVASPLAPGWLVPPADANALAEHVWPAAARRRDDGQLELGGVAVRDLVAQYGTPVLVLDEGEVRDRARRTREAFQDAAARHGTQARVYYAGKAFLSTEVARWVTEEGLRVDVCTRGELEVALAAGVPADHLGFHGNNKSVTELERAVEVGIGSIVIDSVWELDRLAAIVARLGREDGGAQDVLLRVNTGVHAETHHFLATSHEDQKFGFGLEAAPDLVARVRATPGLNLVGLHCHIGSQIFGTDGFRASAARLLGVLADLPGGPLPVLNLGGGFGIAYTSADEPTPIAELAEGIVSVVASEAQLLGIPVPFLAFEPGRSIVGTAGVTLYEVGTTKDVSVETSDGARSGVAATRRYVSVDGGMSDNPRPALYDAQFSARIADRTSTAEPALVRVVGKHCESGDIVVDAEYLPADVAPGDLLAVPATGAYCYALASNYNHVPRPPIVAVRDGASRVIVRGETIDDLLARDAGLAGRRGDR